MKNKAIEIQDLVIDYGNSIAVDHINLEVERGDLVTLLGPSGCGKSTTLNALAGLITTTSGKIYFEGDNVTKKSPKERDIGLVFQSYALYPHMTVYQNIAFPLVANDKFKEQIEKENKEVDLEILKYKYELSGAKDFQEKINIYKDFVLKSESIKEEIEEANTKTKNNIKMAKGLKDQIKVRRDGRIKSHSEKTLKLITENEEKIEELRKEAGRIKTDKLIDDESQEKMINSIREMVSKLTEINNSAFNEYEVVIENIKNDFKQEINNAKKEKERIISEVKVWNKSEQDRLTKELDKLNDEFKSKAEESLSTIKSISEKQTLTEEQQEDVKEISARKSSWKVKLDERVREVAERVGITDQLDKKVTDLSGGQQQRVAISRTLVKSPKVLLLDEPLSNLDAKMRVQTREWIRNLQQELGITTVFVTHDQEEAMSISDKIVCMSKGLIQQVDEPMEMYHNPANKFVAGFLGMPQMNFIELDSTIGKEISKTVKAKKIGTFGIRPEHVKLSTEIKKTEAHPFSLKGKVTLIESFGREKLVTVNIEEHFVKLFTEDIKLTWGDEVSVQFKKDKLYLFDDSDNEVTIGKK